VSAPDERALGRDLGTRQQQIERRGRQRGKRRPLLDRVSKAAWQTIASIKTAITALEANGDRDMIRRVLGNNHKVRAFYHNMLDPDSPYGDVTIDTHVVGAALFRPLPRSREQVRHNWNAAYAFYADAIRSAAKELGLKPRQLQSIIWEAKRFLFRRLTKMDVDAIEDAWKQYHRGNVALDETRKAIFRIARNYSMPARSSIALPKSSTRLLATSVSVSAGINFVRASGRSQTTACRSVRSVE
jgi:hypothetical protein